MSQIIINLNNVVQDEDKDDNKPKRDTTSNLTSVFINQCVEVAKNAIVKSVSASFNRHHSLYEDYIGEQTSRNYATVIGKSAAILTPLMMGKPVIAAGVLMYDVISSYNKYVDAMQRLNTTDYNTNFGRVRAGLVDNGKGTEN